MMRPQNQIVFLPQEKRYVVNLERLLDHRANTGEQILEIHDRGALLGDGVDRFQLPGSLALQRVQARILQSD